MPACEGSAPTVTESTTPSTPGTTPPLVCAVPQCTDKHDYKDGIDLSLGTAGKFVLIDFLLSAASTNDYLSTVDNLQQVLFRSSTAELLKIAHASGHWSVAVQVHHSQMANESANAPLTASPALSSADSRMTDDNTHDPSVVKCDAHGLDIDRRISNGSFGYDLDFDITEFESNSFIDAMATGNETFLTNRIKHTLPPAPPTTTTTLSALFPLAVPKKESNLSTTSEQRSWLDVLGSEEQAVNRKREREAIKTEKGTTTTTSGSSSELGGGPSAAKKRRVCEEECEILRGILEKVIDETGKAWGGVGVGAAPAQGLDSSGGRVKSESSDGGSDRGGSSSPSQPASQVQYTTPTWAAAPPLPHPIPHHFPYQPVAPYTPHTLPRTHNHTSTHNQSPFFLPPIAPASPSGSYSPSSNTPPFSPQAPSRAPFVMSHPPSSFSPIAAGRQVRPQSGVFGAPVLAASHATTTHAGDMHMSVGVGVGGVGMGMAPPVATPCVSDSTGTVTYQENMKLPLGEQGRAELKALISDKLRTCKNLKSSVGSIARLKCATIPQLLRMAVHCGLWNEAVAISERFLRQKQNKQQQLREMAEASKRKRRAGGGGGGSVGRPGLGGEDDFYGRCGGESCGCGYCQWQADCRVGQHQPPLMPNMA
ncbi:unnamed protein product [Vitrella brassicaformis CCMP3155]|uniref:Uncharacterized protein n=3 Tax=Vitrella brassicaformis TaxID=1169539 RepID=A0A0G4EDL5_VITBC|nr:unnamed protein product [Vitrella brassicaformis CCMP3155]|eukprot:CEL93610.1 unnamed protein product [Vitrella brassicaformis CCMP3155]